MINAELQKTIASVREELLLGAEETKNMRNYCQVMFSLLSSVLKADKACLNLCQFEEERLSDDIKSYIHHLPQQVISNYQETCDYDFYTPQLIKKFGLGVAVNSDHLIPYDKFVKSAIYQQHCRHFEMEHVLGLVGSIPYHLNQYIALYLFHSDPEIPFTKEDTQLLNALYPTIMLTWLYQMEIVDALYMKNCSRSLSQFDDKPRLLEFLKLKFNHPNWIAKEYAEELGIEKTTVDKYSAEIFNRVKIRGYGKNKQLQLVMMFSPLFNERMDNE
jgi:hypothetical protein